MKRTLLFAASLALMLACQPAQQPGTTPLKPPTTPTTPSTPEGNVSVTVTTLDANSVTDASATLSGSYTGAPAGGVYDRGVYFGTSAGSLTKETGLNSSTATSGSFSVVLTELSAETTYYYKAYVTVLDASANTYVEFTGQVKSFTTTALTTGTTLLGYHQGYEVPAIAFLDGTGQWESGQETPAQNNSGSFIGENQDNVWFKSYTTNDKQVVVTHTFQSGGKRVRNWTGLIDKDKQGPLWIAFVMHGGLYPRNSVGRYDRWTQDPAVPGDWQRSLASSTHSRGHFVASDYRQNSVDANSQTFYYTNQALQWQNGFNSGIWSSLESAVVSNTPSGSDSLYVVVGVLYENPNTYQTPNSGGAQVLAPSHFYKLLMKCSFGSNGTMTAAKGCAYLFENKSYSGSAYSSYITSIDAVEQRAGFDFFANVPKSLQDAAEAQTSAIW